MKKKEVEKQQQQQQQQDKLRDGPCADIFRQLLQCGEKKRMPYGKKQLEACPTETDRLITCMNKNPLYFHSDER